jgi:hypothetical protein
MSNVPSIETMSHQSAILAGWQKSPSNGTCLEKNVLVVVQKKSKTAKKTKWESPSHAS